MKQTAVEKLVAHLIEYGFDLSAHKLEIEKAKEIEERNQDFFSIKFTEWCLDLLLNNEEIQAKTTIELLNLFKQKQIRYGKFYTL